MADPLSGTRLHLRIADALGDLEPLFTPGMKLTFIARHPTNPDAHVLCTSDTLADLAAMIAHRSAHYPEG